MWISFYPPGPLVALELQNWNSRRTTGRKQALTDPDLFDGRMFATSPGCPAYLLKMRDYLCSSDSAQRARSQKRRFQFQKSTQKLIRFDNVSATVALVRLNNPARVTVLQ
jgi:hypothetical protein